MHMLSWKAIFVDGNRWEVVNPGSLRVWHVAARRLRSNRQRRRLWKPWKGVFEKNRWLDGFSGVFGTSSIVPGVLKTSHELSTNE